MPDLTLMTQLLAATVRLSGLAPMPVQELPGLHTLPAADLRAQACPAEAEACINLAGWYDTLRHRILISEPFDPRSARDLSFVVHELVHVLERRQLGERYQADCEATLKSERRAYRVQNAYLQEHQAPERYGRMLLNVACAPDQPGGAGVMRLELMRQDDLMIEAFMDDYRRGQVQQAVPEGRPAPR